MNDAGAGNHGDIGGDCSRGDGRRDRYGQAGDRRCLWRAEGAAGAHFRRRQRRRSRRSTSWRRNPNSGGRKQIVAEELANAGADEDPELVAAAEQVLAKLQELPQGEGQHIMQAVGSYIAQADRGGTAKVTVTGKP